MNVAIAIGSPRLLWVRDFALVGAGTALAAPLAAMILVGSLGDAMIPYLTGSTAAGLVTGAAVGAIGSWAVASRPRWPKIAFLGMGLVGGAFWGAAVGAIAGLAMAVRESSHDPGIIVLSMCLAIPVGALQLGWFGLAYALRRSRHRTVRGLMLGAVAAAPALGLAMIGLLALALGPKGG